MRDLSKNRKKLEEARRKAKAKKAPTNGHSAAATLGQEEEKALRAQSLGLDLTPTQVMLLRKIGVYQEPEREPEPAPRTTPVRARAPDGDPRPLPVLIDELRLHTEKWVRRAGYLSQHGAHSKDATDIIYHAKWLEVLYHDLVDWVHNPKPQLEDVTK